MLIKEFENGTVRDDPFTFGRITLLSPGDDDDVDDEDGDWSDIDDEDFEDRVEDENDLHEILLDNDLFDPDDDDHLPEDDFE